MYASSHKLPYVGCQQRTIPVQVGPNKHSVARLSATKSQAEQLADKHLPMLLRQSGRFRSYYDVIIAF